MAVVVLLGVAGIVTSRQERRSELASSASQAPPVANRDHWHAAYGIYLCNEFAPNITSERDPKGIHTHADGIIHIHPSVRSAAGPNATLGVYADAVQMRLTDEEIRIPGGKSFKEGSTKCEGKPGIVQVQIDGDKVVNENIRDIKFTDRQLLTIAFAPEGAILPRTPTASGLDNLTDVAPPSTVPVPPQTTETTTAEGATTTAPADGNTSTTAP